jgi:hypothetical protein
VSIIPKPGSGSRNLSMLDVWGILPDRTSISVKNSGDKSKEIPDRIIVRIKKEESGIRNFI